jgi:hypothetical protein
MCGASPIPGWTRLLRPPYSVGYLWHLCTGCQKLLSQQQVQFCCGFCDSGFQTDASWMRPCFTCYHTEYICLGLPFTSPLPKDGRMDCPKDLATLIHYICEACIVCSVLGQELFHAPADWSSLCLSMLGLWTLPTTGLEAPFKPTSQNSMSSGILNHPLMSLS